MLIKVQTEPLRRNLEEYGYHEERSKNQANISTAMEIGGILLILCGFTLWCMSIRKVVEQRKITGW